MRSNRAFALGLLLASSGHGAADAADQKKNFKVAVEIACEGSQKQEFESYLSRELRALGDVTVVDTTDKPDYKLSVCVVVPELYSSPLAVSFVITKPKEFASHARFCAAHYLEGSQHRITKKQSEAMEPFFKSLERPEDIVVGQMALSFSRSAIEQQCKQLITGLDSNHLQPVRKDNARFEEIFAELDESDPPTTVAVVELTTRSVVMPFKEAFPDTK